MCGGFVEDVVDAVSDVVGGVVDAAVDVVTSIPVIGEIADDQLGLDPNGGGIVPIVKGVATGVVLSPVTGLIGPAINSSLGLGLGTAGQAALGGATFGAATGGAQGAVYGAAGGYLGSVASEAYNDAFNRTTVTFDDGSQLTYNTSTGAPVSGLDYNGNSFTVSNGVATYRDGTPLGGAAQTNFGSNQSWSDYTPPPPPPPPPEWQQAGFGNEASYADATLRGFDDAGSYNQAMSGGFEDAGTFNDAVSRGFTDINNYTNAVAGGFDNATDYFRAANLGFDQATDFTAAQAGGFPTADSYFDAKNMGFDRAGDFYDAQGQGFVNAEDYYTTKASNNFTWQDIDAIKKQGYTTQDIADLAREGFTGQDVRMLQADGYSINEIENMLTQYDPNVVRQFSMMDYSQADINMLKSMGMTDQQIINLANSAVDPNTVKVWSDMGYNPKAVVNELITKGNLNDLYAAGAEASYQGQYATPVTPPTDVTWSDIAGQEKDLVSNVGGEPTTNIVDEIVNNVRPEDQGTSEPVVVIANPSDVPGTGGLHVDINGDIIDTATGENFGNVVENGFNETAPGVFTDGSGTTITTIEIPGTAIAPVAPPVIPPTSDLSTPAPGVSPEVVPPVIETPVVPNTPLTPPTDTTVVIDNDGSIVVSDSNTGQVIGTVDTAGNTTGGISVNTGSEGDVLISDSTGNPLGGVDSSGNVFDITNGQGTYQGGGTSLGGDIGGATGGVLGSGTGGTGGGGTGGTTGPVTPETPVTPPPTPEVPVIDNSTPYVPTTPPPVDADIPPIIPVVPNPPTPPTYPPGPPYVPPPPDPRWTKPLGENDWFPAYIAQVAGTPYYPTTDDTQGRYYWGAHTYVPIGGDITKYNQMSYAPTQAWGNRPQARPVAGPIAPAVYGPNMTPLR